MSPVEDALRRTITDLERLRVEFALVGGLAVSIRTEPRFTRDVDCAVAVDDDRLAERLVAELLQGGYRATAQIEQDARGRLATVRLRGPADPDATVDLLFASSGIERDLVSRADRIELLPDLSCKVATVGDLIALKLLARDDERRPQDRADLVALRRAASTLDLDRAREAVRWIVERGFARDRVDLAARLDAFLTERTPD